jgi:hypothetical protein
MFCLKNLYLIILLVHSISSLEVAIISMLLLEQSHSIWRNVCFLVLNHRNDYDVTGDGGIRNKKNVQPTYTCAPFLHRNNA